MIPYLTARSMGQIPPSMTEAQYNAQYGQPSGVSTWQTPDPFANPTVTQTTNTQANPGAGVTDYGPLNNAMTAMGNQIGTAGDKWDQMRAERAARGPVDNTPNPNAGPNTYPNGKSQGMVANAKQAAPLYNWSLQELLATNDPQRIFDNREMLTQMAQQQYGSRYNMAPSMQYLKMMGDGQIKGWTPTQATGTGAAAPTTPQTTQPGGTSVLDVLRNSYGNTPIPGMDSKGGPGPTNPGMYGNPIGDTNLPSWAPGGSLYQGGSLTQGSAQNVGNSNPIGSTMPVYDNQWQPYTQAQMSTQNNVGHSYQPLNNALMQQRQPMDYKQGGGWQNKVTQPWQNWGG